MQNSLSFNRTLIIVGHPNSGYQHSHALLKQAGVLTTKPSRQHALLPGQIANNLIKRSSLNADFFEEIEQIKPSPLWHSLALDLLLGNEDQPLWGWADPQAIHMLEYWYEADPSFYFVLVYDDPASALVRAFFGQNLDSQQLAVFMQGWQHYNAAMLRFYSRHQDRSLLVHEGVVADNPTAFIHSVSQRLGVKFDVLGELPKRTQYDKQFIQIATNLLHEQVSCRENYEELQAMADMAEQDLEASLPLASWNAYTELVLGLTESRQKIEESQIALAERDTRIQFFKSQTELKNSQFKELEEENELLLLQLHQVQEELERYYLENQALKNIKLKELEEKNRHLQLQINQIKENQVAKKDKSSAVLLSPPKPKPAPLYGAEERVKQQLAYRLGRTMIQKTASIGGVITLPFALIKQVKEFNRDKKSNAGKKLPPIERYADAVKAEKIRQHLSFRLGKVLIENYRSPIGWVKLPFVMHKEIENFHRDRTQQHR